MRDKTKDLYNLHEILDPTIGLGKPLKGFERFVDLAICCVEDSRADRPTMSEVVKEIENIMQLAGLNPNAESASTSASYEETSMGDHPYSNDSLFSYSEGFPPPKLETPAMESAPHNQQTSHNVKYLVAVWPSGEQAAKN
ncbi:hypothetical protein F0562_020145 [Nyssa sinensis]|uniref:Serine-threonine/tyrosine-protein kinase catalytic domain-containing protein n=1 Tax=Nyssa sinensis TaxID=561372 RepID=A0A5J5BVP3_9ASTE|nr:hypothetical protein F0562_020145 [Nyssa sinensis]